ERAARRLEDVLGDLHSSVQGVSWVGPDADSFREQWEGTRRQGEGLVVPGLGERSRELKEHAEEQEQASSTEDGGWFEDALAWRRDAGKGIVDGIRDGISWVGDRLGEGLDWFRGLEWPRLSERVVD